MCIFIIIHWIGNYHLIIIATGTSSLLCTFHFFHSFRSGRAFPDIYTMATASCWPSCTIAHANRYDADNNSEVRRDSSANLHPYYGLMLFIILWHYRKLNYRWLQCRVSGGGGICVCCCYLCCLPSFLHALKKQVASRFCRRVFLAEWLANRANIQCVEAQIPSTDEDAHEICDW